METEQRKFKRLLPQNLTFAVIRPHFSNLGKVKDISRGGMAYEYILNETLNTGYAEIDIFLSSDSFYLPRIPSKIIYDTKIVEKFQKVETRRCGVQFRDLTEEQAANLELLLKNHTTGTT